MAYYVLSIPPAKELTMNALETICLLVLFAFAAVGAASLVAVLWTGLAPQSAVPWARAIAELSAAGTLAAWSQTLCIAAGFTLVASLLSRKR